MDTSADDRPLALGLAAINKAVPQKSTDKDKLVASKCRGLLRGYHQRWSATRDQFSSTVVEHFVQSQSRNPDTSAASRTFNLAGKIDVLAVKDGKLGLLDHKTTSNDLKKRETVMQLMIESQPSHYALIQLLNGEKINWCIWDMIRKPGISPRKLTKAEIHILEVEGKHFDQQVSTESIKESIAEGREGLELYEARLYHECAVEDPDRYFARKSVPRLDGEILDYARDQWDIGQEIINARANDRWPRNSGACMLYGSPCKFLAVCAGLDSFDSGGWQRKAQVHAELPILQGDGRNTLTNSRMRCFQTCRRKHLYEYEEGWVKMDEEEREALFFGTVLHLGLEAWWQ